MKGFGGGMKSHNLTVALWFQELPARVKDQVSCVG